MSRQSLWERACYRPTWSKPVQAMGRADEIEKGISRKGLPDVVARKAARVGLVVGLIGVLSTVWFAFVGLASDDKPRVAYGKQQDVVLATKLWRVLVARGLAGPDRINVHAFEGTQPHGAIQQIYKATVKVGDHSGTAIVKANHRSDEATVMSVYQTPNKYLAGYTVMFANRPGYDPANKNWFWVKYEPDGVISRSAKGIAIAGRVGKIAKVGCIGCHRVMGGDDLETLTDN